MQRIETLQLRAFRSSDAQAAIDAFQQLIFPDPRDGLGKVCLLHDGAGSHDLCIVIQWVDATFTGKSPLGLRLAAAFSEFGRIDHNVWRYIETPAAPNQGA
jgi:hypothetical protein